MQVLNRIFVSIGQKYLLHNPLFRPYIYYKDQYSYITG